MTTLDRNQFGSWAVVTGSSSGIGEAFARQLAEQGFHLVLVARRAEQLQELAAQLERTHGVQVQTLALDLGDSASIARLAELTEAVDVGLLVSNAGSAFASAFIDVEPDALERDVTLNVLAHLKLAHHFGRRLAKRGRGGLLLVSSIAGRQGVPYLASYAAAKAFVSVLGESIHSELRPFGVISTVLVPGPTDTALRNDMGFGRSRLKPMSAEECARAGLHALARGRATYMPGRRIRLVTTLVPRRVITRILGRVTAQFARRRAPTLDAAQSKALSQGS